MGQSKANDHNPRHPPTHTHHCRSKQQFSNLKLVHDIEFLVSQSIENTFYVASFQINS